jgi:hypothetical protein
MQGCASSSQGHCGLTVKQHHTTNDLGGCSKWLDPVHIALLYESKHKRHIAKDHSQHFRAFKMTSDSQNSPPAMTLQRSNVTIAGERRSHRTITVASLCCEVDEANSAFTASTKGHQSYGLKASSTSDAALTRATCYRLERPGLAATLPLPQSVHSEHRNGFGLATQTFLSSRFDTTKALGSAYDVIGSRNMSVPPSSAPPVTADRDQVLHTRHNVNLQIQPPTQIAFTESSQRVPRLPRPSYTEEQRFFIMYHRIIRELS